MQQQKKKNSQNQIKQSSQVLKTQSTDSKRAIQVEERQQPEDVNLISQSKSANPLPSDQEQKAQSSILKYFRPLPDPPLVWEPHIDKNLISEFQELIENRFLEVIMDIIQLIIREAQAFINTILKQDSKPLYIFQIFFNLSLLQVTIHIMNFLMMLHTIGFAMFSNYMCFTSQQSLDVHLQIQGSCQTKFFC